MRPEASVVMTLWGMATVSSGTTVSVFALENRGLLNTAIELPLTQEAKDCGHTHREKQGADPFRPTGYPPHTQLPCFTAPG
jgi:hypothetical protein